jgi:hypothetical protein
MNGKEKKTRTRKNATAAVQSGAIDSSELKKKTRKKPAPAAAPVNGSGPARKTPRKAAVPSRSAARVPHEEIAKLAHRYWAERGGQHGHHVEDWLRAERELLGKAS